MATLKNTTIDDIGFLQLPSGTTGERPVSPQNGMIRFNTTLNQVEFYQQSSTSWVRLIEKPKALGGEISIINGYYVHIFKGSGQFVVKDPNLTGVDVLLVGAGGSGGSWYGGGGGAGGLVFKANLSVSPRAYPVVVGSGGVNPAAGSNSNQGSDGGASMFAGLVALGGGGGGSGVSTISRPGGSGGSSSGTAGAGGSGSGGAALQPSHPSGGFGNAGATYSSGVTSNGGGGGAGVAGNANGAGGNGLYQVTISPTTYDFYTIFGAVGQVVGGNQSWFAGGGTGGCNSPIQPAGLGGGGGAAAGVGLPATANTGGGGGGQCTSNSGVGVGGSGIVIIRYLP